MTLHILARSALARPSGQASATMETSHGRLFALIREWRNRRAMARGLGGLSAARLRDIGLTGADVEAACADSIGMPASLALTRAAEGRVSNW